MFEYTISSSLPLVLVASGVLYFVLSTIHSRLTAPRGSLSDIPGPPSDSWWQGNLHQFLNPKAWQFHHDVVAKYGSAVKIHGLFGAEHLYTFDPKALHHIAIKDQDIYEETSAAVALNLLAFGRGLLSLHGAAHRKQRKMLNPVFSIKHMRGLIEVFYPIAHLLGDRIEDEVRSGKTEVNVMGWFSRAALDYIGQGGLGYSFESLDLSKKNVYGDAVKMFIPVLIELDRPIRVLPYLINIGPAWFRRLVIDFLPFKPVQKMKNIVDIMQKTSEDIVAQKRKALEIGEESVVRQMGVGKDIMSILLRANMEANEKDRLSEEELIGQMSLFIFAGHDTTTTALTRILWVLSQDLDAQERLRQEVTKARAEHGDLNYDTLMNLPYLDAVCRETMRLYPPVSVLERVTRKDVVLPLLHPIPGELTKDGKPIDQIYLKNNTKVTISIISANRSKTIWGEDAEEWKPERWLVRKLSDDEKEGDLFTGQSRTIAKEQLPGVYSGMMTFFGGGRACIGFKFSEMEMKLVLSVMLERFKFEPGSEVYWNMTGIAVPTVVGQEATGPQLPLKVSLVKN